MEPERHDYMDPVDDKLDGPSLPLVTVVVVLVLAFIWLLVVGAGSLDAAAPPPQAPPVQAPPVQRETPATGRPPSHLPHPSPVLVPGWWVQGADGLWRFQTTAPEVRAPRPFPVPHSIPTTGATTAGPVSTSSPVPVPRPALIRIGVPGAATSGFTNCGPLG
jgi:hypothetical protein